MTSLTIPENVTSIGEDAFENCYKLVEIYNLSKTLNIKKGDWNNEYLGFYALDIHTDKNAKSKIKDVGDYIFYEDEEVYLLGYKGNDTDLILPNYNGKTYEIYQYAFYYSNITSIMFPDNVTSIGDSAFSGCSSLTSMTIPSGVRRIYWHAFENCSSLKSVTFGSNSQLTNIGGYAFYNCSSITTITIPSSITSIGDSAFLGCGKLVEVYNLSETLTITKSSSNGFVGCYAFDIYTDKATPSKIKDVGDYIFYEDEEVYLLGYKGNDTDLILPNYNGKTYEIYQYAFYYSNITSVTIPSSVTSIGSYAFEGCSSLTDITIPENVTIIGAGAFEGCSSLKSVTFKNTAGWHYGSSGTEIIGLDNPETAAQYLREAYEYSNWYREDE